MEETGQGTQPIDLLAAYSSPEHPRHQLARALISQIYTYMGARGTCYGFISCWLATWLLYCPPNNRSLLYLSDPFLAATTATAASAPSPDASGSSTRSTAATVYGALAFLQWLALDSASRLPQLQVQWQQPGVGMPPTGRGPSAGGGHDGGHDHSGGGSDGGGSGGGSAGEPDAGASAGSDESYRPTASELAAAQGTSSGSELRMSAEQQQRQQQLRQELQRVATAAEPALPMVAQRPTAAAAVRLPWPSRVLLRFGEELSGGGSEGLVVAGTCDGVACVIKLLGPDRSGLAAYEREVPAYLELEALQGLHVPELLAWGDLDWGVRFLAVRRVAGGVPLSDLPYPIPAAVAAAALRALEAVQAACPGFLHGDVRLENVLVVQPQAGPASLLPSTGATAVGSGAEVRRVGVVESGAGGGGGSCGATGGGDSSGVRASGTQQLRCVLLDFGRSRLDGDPGRQRQEREQLQQLLGVAAAAAHQQQQA